MSSNGKTIGIDQSFTSTGVVVLNSDGGVEHVERIVGDKSLDLFERAWRIGNRIVEICDGVEPTSIAMEGLAFTSRGDATRDLAGLQFTLVNMIRHIAKNAYDVHILPPQEVKKFATNKGKADKNEMIASLPTEVRSLFDQHKFKKTTGLTDVTDAYWIAQLGKLKGLESVAPASD